MENRPDGHGRPVRTLYDTIMQKIMFNDKYGLTQAVLEGRKTMTRRVVSENLLQQAEAYRHEFYNSTLDALPLEDALLELSPFKIGDVVAVAQRYKDVRDIIGDGPHDGKFLKFMEGWNNKMFVRADLMPHQIRITNIRVERLQNISDEDGLLEGIVASNCKTCFNGYAYDWLYDQDGDILATQWFKTPREAFAALIDKISGKGTWEMNPFVFVYEFERIR